MKKLLVALAFPLLLSGCLSGTQGAEMTPATTIARWHDNIYKVTCWIYANGYKSGLSCLPDNELVKQ